jgi:hypothetical protein
MVGQRTGLSLRAKLLAVLLAGGAIAIIAAFGGLRASATRRRPQIAAGQSVDAGEWRVRPLRAWMDGRCPTAGATAPAASCLHAEVECTNLTSASRMGVASALRLVDPPAPAGVEPHLTLVCDGTVLGLLHPQMPERVVMGWKLAAERPADPLRAAAFAVWARRFKERDNLLGGEGWFDPKQVAQVRLPVTLERAPGAGETGAQ